MKTVILKPAPAMEIWIWDRCIYRARSRSSGRVRTSYLRFLEIDLESFGKLVFGVFCGGQVRGDPHQIRNPVRKYTNFFNFPFFCVFRVEEGLNFIRKKI